LPLGNATPAGAFFLYRVDDATGLFAVSKGDEHLIQYDLVEYLESGFAKPACETLSMLAAPVDQFGKPRAAERVKSCILCRSPRMSLPEVPFGRARGLDNQKIDQHR
jgi:hypothetical protein